MKTINETFEDSEYELLIEKKGKKTWRQFILDLANTPAGGGGDSNETG